MKLLKSNVVYLLLLFFLIGRYEVYAQLDKAEVELKQMMEKLRVAGLSVAVVKDGKITYSNAFGLKNIERNMPLATDDIFRIASISKSFCATAIMQLVEAKKLSLDDDVSDLLGFKIRNPHFPDKVITLKMLLSHTSSINDSAGYFNYDAIDPEKNNGGTKCYSDYEPGTTFKYCNLNFNLIGSIIEKASGVRFDNYIKQNILDPIGVYAGFNVDSLDREKFVSLYTYNKKSNEFDESKTAYVANRKIWNDYKLGYSAYSFSPTGGMKISASDLAKVMLMHLNKGNYNGKQIISKSSAEQMQSPLVETGTGGHYGYAIRLYQSPELAGNNLLVGHTGSASGLYSAMFFNPKKKFGFVVISSGSLPDSYDMPFAFRSVLADGINILYNNFIK